LVATGVKEGVIALVAGGALAAVTVVGLVSAKTSPSDQSPADVNQPVKIEYGTNG
jgi:hypothetical protein